MNELASINLKIEKSQKAIDTAESLKRLRDNKDFSSVIMEQYLGSYASDLVRAKASPGMQSTEDQKYIDNQINAVGHFSQYMDIKLTQGVTAKSTIESCKEDIEYLMNEEEEDA